MKLETQKRNEVKTHLLNKVDRFDEFFDLYKMEYQWHIQRTDAKLRNLESFLLRTLPISHRFITWQDHNTSFLAPFSLIEKVLSVPASAETDPG